MTALQELSTTLEFAIPVSMAAPTVLTITPVRSVRLASSLTKSALTTVPSPWFKSTVPAFTVHQSASTAFSHPPNALLATLLTSCICKLVLPLVHLVLSRIVNSASASHALNPAKHV